MEIFSRTLARLYEVAEHTTPDRLPAEILRALMSLIRFDAAVLGIGEVDITCRNNLTIQQTHVHDMDYSGLSEHAQASHCDPVSSEFANRLPQPLSFDCNALFTERRRHKLQAFAQRHNLRKLLACGNTPAPKKSPRWLVLYRSGEPEFSELDTAHLHVAWPHVTQAIQMNLNRALNNVDLDRTKRALALINSSGLIEVADPGLMNLLRLEWLDFDGSRLPDTVMKELISSNFYCGRRIELSTFHKFGYMACVASLASVIRILAPSEIRVAHRFAGGMTHSEIAAHLGVSPHTVRNQLAQIYQKLGIHGKAELVRVLTRTSEATWLDTRNSLTRNNKRCSN